MLPGAVALVARGNEVEVAAAGVQSLEGGPTMAPDSIFRIASITKPITAAAVMVLVDDGVLRLDSPIEHWLPELAAPMVVRTPTSPVDDVVPANRPITVFDLLTNQAGYGFASDFELPAVQALFAVQKDGREPANFPPQDEWTAQLGKLPLAYQPGEGWLYDTPSTIQGVLIARASGRELPEFLAERLFEPLDMPDTRPRRRARQARPLHQLLPRRRLRPRPRRRPRRPVEPAAGPRSGQRRSRRHRARLAELRPHAPLRRYDANRSPRPFRRRRTPDAHRPHHAGPPRDRQPLPERPGLGLRRFRGHHRRPPLEHPRPLRLDRRHRHLRPHPPHPQQQHHPPDPAFRL